MNHKSRLTRRQFLGRVSLVAGAAQAFGALPAIAGARGAPELQNAVGTGTSAASSPVVPVISLHVDQLYLDKSGTALPYVPPAGARSGQPVSELSDLEYLSRHPYF